MTFQEKMFEATADLRAHATALATAALDTARTRAGVAAKRVEVLKGSIATLSSASRELRKVARGHAARFVKENTALAIDAGNDVSSLARSTYATLAKRQAAKPKARKPQVARKRGTAKAA